MTQCVPSWDVDHPPNPSPRLLPSSSSSHPQPSMSDYEVAELTWSNGHLSAHGLAKPTPKYPPFVGGTLESIVNQAKLLQPAVVDALDAWRPATGPSTTHHLPAAADALVPTHRRQQEDITSGIGSCDNGRKRARVGEHGTNTTTPVTAATASIDTSMRVADDTDDFGFTTTNSGTPFADDGNGVSGTPDTENTSFGGGGGSRPTTVVDDHDSVCHSQRSMSQRETVGEEDEKLTDGGAVRSTISTKRSRAAAIHNQSERKRRDRINQKMRTLQKLVPNSSKIDKASMLDEVINYMKQLQAQVQMMSKMSSMPPMMMPMSMQHFQMTMMAQMAQFAQMAQMGMGMGMMDMASLGRAGLAGMSPVMPTSAFLPMMSTAAGSWDPSAGTERMQQPAGAVMPDPFSAFFPSQPQPQQSTTMDAYQRMTALYQQMFQQNQPTHPK